MRNTVATLLLLLLAAERNALRVIRADQEREATTERVAMPPMMARGFRMDLRVGGKWQTVYEDTENFLRLRKVSFAPVKADAARLVVTSTWGDEKAHVFAFDIN